jgi:hypothetical protein
MVSDQDYTEIDQLHKDDLKTAQILDDVIGKRLVLMLYSKVAKHRAHALSDLNMGLARFPFKQIDKLERQKIFVALWSVMNRGVHDGDRNVNLNAITLLIGMV